MKKFLKRVDEIAKSPSGRRRAYTRKVGGALSALFCFAFAFVFELYETSVGISPYRYSLCAVAMIVAIVLGFALGDRLAAKRFKD
jgi:hypothetical protein